MKISQQELIELYRDRADQSTKEILAEAVEWGFRKCWVCGWWEDKENGQKWRNHGWKCYLCSPVVGNYYSDRINKRQIGCLDYGRFCLF